MGLRSIRGMLALSVVLSACGREEPRPPAVVEKNPGPSADAPKPPSKPAVPTGDVFTPDPATAGTVKGRVVYKGEPPKKGRAIVMKSDSVCAGAHADDVYSDKVVLNENGTLKNAIVFVAKGLEGKAFAVPADALLLDQEGCWYKPHVLAAMAGQTLTVRNSDPTLHNVHSASEKNEFNVAQTTKGQESKFVLGTPEAPFRIKCDAHSWMSAWCAVFAHPYFAVTGDDGSFTFGNLPPGNYTVEAWHENWFEKDGNLAKNVTLGAKATEEIEFTFEGR